MSKTLAKACAAALAAALGVFAVAGCSSTTPVSMTNHEKEMMATLSNAQANSSFSTIQLEPNQQLAMEYNISAGNATVEVEESNSSSVLSDYPDLSGEGTETITAPAGTIKVRVRGYDGATGTVNLAVEFKKGSDATGTFSYDTAEGDTWEAASSDEAVVKADLEPQDETASTDTENTSKTSTYTLKAGKEGKATITMTHKQPGKKDEVAKYTVEVDADGNLSITKYDGADSYKSTFSVNVAPEEPESDGSATDKASTEASQSSASEEASE